MTYSVRPGAWYYNRIMKNFYKKGITAVELLIVISVLGIIFSIIIPQFSKIKENQLLKNGVEDIVSSINKARGQTLASINSSSYGVHFQSDKVIIFEGTVFSANDPDNEILDITSPVAISTITITGGGTYFYFNRLNGMPSATGTIVVSSTNFTKSISISATGIVSVN